MENGEYTNGSLQEAEKVVAKRKRYVRSVSQRFNTSVKKNIVVQPRTLFDCLIIVGLCYNREDDTNKPYVKYIYPPEVGFTILNKP